MVPNWPTVCDMICWYNENTREEGHNIPCCQDGKVEGQKIISFELLIFFVISFCTVHHILDYLQLGGLLLVLSMAMTEMSYFR